MKSYFPDVNVWIALAYEGHQHHASATSWFARLDGEAVYFCRFTQLGLLRLLTHPSVMREDVRNQTEAWQTYDSFLGTSGFLFTRKPTLSRSNPRFAD